MEGEPPVIFEAKTITAKKQHECLECRRTIEAGARYVRSKGLWPTVNGWDTYATCVLCEQLRTELEDPYWGTAPFGDLQEWAQSSAVDFPPTG